MPKNARPQKQQSNQEAASFNPALLDAALKDYRGPEDFDAVFQGLKKALVERALGGELAHHLGYQAGAEKPAGQTNCRNGKTRKTLRTEEGELSLRIPRDREGSFEPQLIKKDERRLSGFDEKVIALYARGLTVREIQGYLEELYGDSVSPDLISEVTDEVMEEVREWQNRPLDAMYVIMYIDALVVKIRTDGRVANRPVYLVTGVDVDGYKHVLGVWIGSSEGEGKAYWANVLTELHNRGVADVLIVCCDGLKGLPEAIGSVWAKAEVQTCVIHLIRASMRFVSYTDRKKVAAAIKPIYTAINEHDAHLALDKLREQYGGKYRGLIATWERAWEEFIPFLKYPKEIRKVVYTTNAIESLNFQLRKIIKNRGHFTSEDAASKLIYLGIRNFTGRHIDGDGTVRSRGERGTGTYGWKNALNHFADVFGDRLAI